MSGVFSLLTIDTLQKTLYKKHCVINVYPPKFRHHPPTDMVLDDRLKKRAVSQSFKNDSHFSGDDHANRPSKTGGSPLGPYRISSSAASGRTRIRRRVKGPDSKKIISVRCLRRKAMNFARKLELRRRGDPWTYLKPLGFLLIVGVLSFIFLSGDHHKTKRLRKQVKWKPPEFKIFFSSANSTNPSQTIFEIDAIELGSKGRSDYGGLKLGKLGGQPREISDSAYLSKSKFHYPDQARDDDGNDAYIAFDDDVLRGTEGTLVSFRMALPLQQLSTLRDQNGLTRIT